MPLSNKRPLSYEHPLPPPPQKNDSKRQGIAKRSNIIQFTQILALLTRLGTLHLIEFQAQSKDRLKKTISPDNKTR